jgi:uncharacterized protein (DUF2236 family)
MGASPDKGYFPRETSVLRRVHEQRAVGLLYGQRALAIGAINPLNFIGTRNHTRALARPFQRLVHTAKIFERIFFGTRAEADGVLAMVEHMHETVEGTLAEDAGVTKAGTPYSAFDPEQMLWTVAVSADSARVFYELLVGPLSEEERDAFWLDYVRFGELFGMPREVAPGSHAEFSEYFQEQIERPEAYLTDEAHEVAKAVMFQIPVPASQRPAMLVHNLIILGSLPPRVREMYGLRWNPIKAAAFRSAVLALRGSRPVVPERVRAGSNVSFYDLVARTEKQRIARGETIPGSLSPSAS